MGLLKNLLYSASSEKMLNFFTDQTIFTYYHTVNNEKLNYLDNLLLLQIALKQLVLPLS